MLPTVREIALETIAQNGLSKMFMKAKITTVVLLTLTLALTAWAQPWFTHSTGVGPAFEVAPAVVVPDNNGSIKLSFLSNEKDVIYSAILENNKVIPIKGETLKIKPTLNGMYTYLTIQAITKDDPWDTSVATVLVLSKKVHFDENAPISTFVIPNMVCSSQASDVKVYTVVNPVIGKESFALYENATPLMEKELSPFGEYPQVIEYDLKTNGMKSGEYTFKSEITLVTGEKIAKTSTLTVLTCSQPVINAKVSPTVIGKKSGEFKVSLNVKSTSGIPIEKVWVGEEEASLENSEWEATFDHTFYADQKSGTSLLEVPVKVEDKVGNVFNSEIEKKVCLDLGTPSFEAIKLVDNKGKIHDLLKKRFLSIESWKLPSSYKLEVVSTAACDRVSPNVEITVDGKKIDSNVISIDSYGKHTIKVVAVDPVNKLPTTWEGALEVRKPMLDLPLSWWAVIGIFTAMLISLLLTFY